MLPTTHRQRSRGRRCPERRVVTRAAADHHGHLSRRGLVRPRHATVHTADVGRLCVKEPDEHVLGEGRRVIEELGHRNVPRSMSKRSTRSGGAVTTTGCSGPSLSATAVGATMPSSMLGDHAGRRAELERSRIRPRSGDALRRIGRDPHLRTDAHGDPAPSATFVTSCTTRRKWIRSRPAAPVSDPSGSAQGVDLRFADDCATKRFAGSSKTSSGVRNSVPRRRP